MIKSCIICDIQNWSLYNELRNFGLLQNQLLINNIADKCKDFVNKPDEKRY